MFSLNHLERQMGILGVDFMDKYILGQSELGSISDQHREVILDLNLRTNPYYYNALIYGTVLSCDKQPLEKARISFYDINNREIGYVYSSHEGFYAFYKVKQYSQVRIITSKQDYQTKSTNYFRICTKTLHNNITLNKQPIHVNSLISGHVYNNNGITLENITVYLLYDLGSGIKVNKSTITNEHGQYVFSDIIQGKYYLFVDDSNYQTYKNAIDIAQQEEIYTFNIVLKDKDKQTMISGNVKDENGKILPYALAVLYQVEGSQLIPIAQTRCDATGKYYFANIAFNNYIVKATL